ncbi:MAG: ATP-binding cassette domain-containing protein [Pseudomonadota bacterium]
MTIQITLQQQAPHLAPLSISEVLPSGVCIGVYGPSGSGKTTLLRGISGLSRISGTVQVKDAIWQDENHFLPAHERRAAMVLQSPGLLPHRTVTGNIEFALGFNKRAKPGLLDSILADFGLLPLRDQRADTLSGGEQQRVAMARALAAQPDVLLLDEPLTGLDDEARQTLLQVLMRLKRSGTTCIFVSHSAYEQALLADHLLIMDSGAITKSGSAEQVFAESPPTAALGRELGVVIDDIPVVENVDGLAVVEKDGLRIQLAAGAPPGSSVSIRVRADDVSLTEKSETHSSIMNTIPAVIRAQSSYPDSPFTLVELDASGTRLFARITNAASSKLKVRAGGQVYAQMKAAAITSF